MTPLLAGTDASAGAARAGEGNWGQMKFSRCQQPLAEAAERPLRLDVLPMLNELSSA